MSLHDQNLNIIYNNTLIKHAIKEKCTLNKSDSLKHDPLLIYLHIK
jgi:hypothetical protein